MNFKMEKEAAKASVTMHLRERRDAKKTGHLGEEPNRTLDRNQTNPHEIKTAIPVKQDTSHSRGVVK